ncbi:tail assembly protein [Agrobacterium phage Atu_ph04]|uniref:Tail assembly protein n=1 Tax=Agrobacterium phage Atu_ph04 TaxID=2024263 RepID=A0A223W079_9CAUD|nr:tail sheath stabilizer [Agrobacterium phage Atu_ph04]ASV44686.2 tail assembly protein [Agrobacterium phage Atu_ph04]
MDQAMKKRRYFSHGHIRSLVTVFGMLFNKIYVARYSDDGSSIDSLIHVPITFLPRSRVYKYDPTWAKEIPKNQQDYLKKYYSVFPRMAFDFEGITYDSSRQLGRNRKHKSGRQYGYVSAPYNVDFTLTIASRDSFFALQILEQIIPYFKPGITIAVKHEVFDGESKDVIVDIGPIRKEDTFANGDSERLVIYTIEFTMKADFWPYVVGADLEVGKFVGCGGKIDYPIDPNWPDDDEGEDDDEFIEKVVIDLHHLDVYDGNWPVIERQTIFEQDGKIVSVSDDDPQYPIPEDKV